MHPSIALWTLRRVLFPTAHLPQPRRRLVEGLRIFVDLENGQMPKPAFYAVARGRTPGVYTTWAECEAQVKGFGGARYKKFPTQAAAAAFAGAQGNGTGGIASVASVSGGRSSPYGRDGAKPNSSSRTKAKSKTASTSSSTSSRSRIAVSPPTRAEHADLPPALLALADKGYTLSKANHGLVVYTDGSSLGNGKRGAAAGAGVFWGGTGEAYKNNLAERVPGAMQTNNRGELLSIIRAIETCPYPDLPLEIRTDSQYSISCMTVWLPKWIANNWNTTSGPVKNADMIRHLLVLLRRRKHGASVRFKYVKGHAGHEGNEAADGLARLGAMSAPVPERTDWLDPDSDEDVGEGEGETDVEADIDPEWLMSAEELAELEQSLAAE